MYLVTGGAGFIGSNLVAALTEQGNAVAVCDVLDHPGKRANLAKHRLVELVAPEALAGWLQREGVGVETVFHLGATSSTTVLDIDHLLDNNFGVSQLLWRWCTAHQCRLIYASSAATYGDGSHGFEDDDDPRSLSRLAPLNPYGLSKHLFDLHAVTLAGAGFHPPQWAGLKFFNVYGPNEQHKGGQRSVVAQLFDQIHSTGRARLFRSHNPVYSDGGQLRDFIWVGDCVDLMLWLNRQPSLSGVFNCGTGVARSFLALAEACFAAMGRRPEIEFIDTPIEIRERYQYFTQATMTRLRTKGYARAFTPLEEGVAAYIRDYLATNDPHR